ncbi:MAG: DUF6279 family lipoprotein [Pseudomonadota bacterium]
MNHSSFRYLIIITSCFILLTGCGFKFAYRNLDFIIPWYVDDFVDLDNQQSSMLEQIIVKHVNWHSKNQLPKYVQLLEDIESQVDSQLTQKDFETLIHKVQSIYREMLYQLHTDIAKMMVSFSDKQIQEVFSEFEKRNKKFKKEYVEPSNEEFYAERYKKMNDAFREWFRYSTKEQKAVLKEWAHALPRNGQVRSEFHQQWQNQLKINLETVTSTDDKTNAIRSTLDLISKGGNSEVKTASNRNVSIAIHYAEVLWPTLEPKQLVRLKDKLSDVKDDLQDLVDYRLFL